MRLAVCLAAVLCFLPAAAAQPPEGAPTRTLSHAPVRVLVEDVEMRRAEATARATFTDFAARRLAPQPRDERFAVRVAVSSAAGTEHVWLTGIALAPDTVIGTLSAGLVGHPGMRAGHRLRAPFSAVTDWAFVEGGVLRGGFTTRVLLDRMPPGERRRTLAAMGVRLD